MLFLFGASKEILPLARQIFSISLFGAVFQITAHKLTGVTRAEGNPQLAMFTMLLGSLINLILNPVFIFILKLRIAGSELATFSSQCIIAAWMISYFVSENSAMKLKLRSIFPNKTILYQILSIGMASFLAQLASGVTLVILNKNLYFYGGNHAVAALGIIQPLTMLILLPVVGINRGM